MRADGFIFGLLVIGVTKVYGQIIDLDQIPTTPFDQNLYKSVLDPVTCVVQMTNMQLFNQAQLFEFLDSGFRIPSGLLDGNVNHLGNYFQCLGISGYMNDAPLQGKYCMVEVPLNQTFGLPFMGEVNGREVMYKQIQNSHKNMPVETLDSALDAMDLSSVTLRFGLCLPQACTTNEWITYMFFNVSLFNFNYKEEYCRLPNDKPWVAADYLTIIVFSALGLATILSTSYDIHRHVTLKKDPKQVNPLYTCFSVYTNGRRLTTFTKNSNALDCLDGIRALSMIWVMLGHVFTMYNHYVNFIDVVDFLISGGAVFISTGVFAVDTFLFMTGLLLVYTSVGKMKSMQLIKGLHLYYLHRILRLFPLLGALALLESSFFFQISDGPYWMNVARNAERCRDWWWTTLLYVQNYVNPENICVEHTWYLAIDMQLHILSPLILFWVLSPRKNLAWTALLGGLLAVLAGATIFNFFMDMPSTHSSVPRIDEINYYMNYYYKNTLTRASAFMYGMILGYMLYLNKGRNVKIRKLYVVLLWLAAFGMFASIFYMQYAIYRLDYKNQLGDNFYNSFSRTAWSLGLCWLIFACVHGYGGPINWFLSLSMWKLPSRISYAMYLYHYPFMFFVAGTRLAPVYFSPAQSLFDGFAHFSFSFAVSIAVTIIIDSPFTTITKIFLGGGVKKKTAQPISKPSDPVKEIESGKDTKESTGEEKENKGSSSKLSA